MNMKLQMKRIASRTREFINKTKNAHFSKMLEALNLGRECVNRMMGSLPIPYGLFAECHSKGGQLSAGCRGGKG